MAMNVKEIEKEIALIKELLELRGKLNNEVAAYKPNTENQLRFDFGKVPVYNTGGFVTDVNYNTIKFGNITTEAASQWSSSEDMWKGVEKPHYVEGGIGPCECEGFVTE